MKVVNTDKAVLLKKEYSLELKLNVAYQTLCPKRVHYGTADQLVMTDLSGHSILIEGHKFCGQRDHLYRSAVLPPPFDWFLAERLA